MLVIFAYALSSEQLSDFDYLGNALNVVCEEITEVFDLTEKQA